MDKKLTDSEIIKALECCAITAKCRQECIFHKYGEEYDVQNCTTHLAQATLELVNRLQAEIERLKAEIDKQYEIAEANVRAEITSGGTSCHWCEDKVRAEAYKEFAEIVKKIDFYQYIEEYYENAELCYEFRQDWFNEKIDNLLKELAGENNETKTF